MTETKKKNTFYIVKEESEDVVKDFQDFVYQLKSQMYGNVIQQNAMTQLISSSSNYSATLTSDLADSEIPEDLSPYAFKLKLTVDNEDFHTFDSFRRFIASKGTIFRIYSMFYRAFVPYSRKLVSWEVGESETNKKVKLLLSRFGLYPLYFSETHDSIFAMAEDESVHIINPYLVRFLLNKEFPDKSFEDISYKVADSVKYFTAKYDARLIPEEFFKYYGRSMKIINDSHWNIDNPGRKVFIKPYIFELDQKKGTFYTIVKETGSLLFMDKLQKGETMNDALLRILRKELNIADDYVGAYVTEDIEYDRDKEDKLIPRLIVFVYVDKIKNRDEVILKSQRSWKSLNSN